MNRSLPQIGVGRNRDERRVSNENPKTTGEEKTLVYPTNNKIKVATRMASA